MASRTLAKDLLYRVSAQLSDAPDPAGQFTHWTERELVNWANDGQKVIATFLPLAFSRIETIELVEGTRQSIEVVPAWRIQPRLGEAATELRGSQVQDVIRNMGSDGLTPGRAIRVVDRQTLDASNPMWHTETGDVVLEYAVDPRDPKTFWVTPGPALGESLWVDVCFVALPSDIPYVEGSLRMDSSSKLRVSIDDAYIDLLQNYMLARAHMKEAEVAANAQLASGYVQMFTGALNSTVKAITGVNPNLKMLPLTPDVPGAAS